MATKRHQAKVTGPAKPDDDTKPVEEPTPDPPVEETGTEAAPIDPPPAERETKIHPAVPVDSSPAISAVMMERHLRVVNASGKPIDVKDVILRSTPISTSYTVTDRVFEETTMPGADAPRRRLLYGAGVIIDRSEFERLVEVLDSYADAGKGGTPAA